MQKKKYPKSDALRREVQCYPPEKYFVLLKGYAQLNETTKSKALVHMMRCFFDSIPADERMRYFGMKQQPTKRISQNRY